MNLLGRGMGRGRERQDGGGVEIDWSIIQLVDRKTNIGSP